jgi:surfactin synthase thioesterase subunit
VVRWGGGPQPRLRLFCFPYAGGGASVFHGWRGQLPHDVEVCAIQLPGRESRMPETPYDSLPDLVPPLSAAIEPLLDRPYLTFGHSLGALVSFELARYLRRAGAPAPDHMFVSASAAPQVGRDDEVIHRLPDDEFLAAVERLNGIAPEILALPDLLELLLPLLRADCTVSEVYRYLPEPPLSCPMTAFHGVADPSVRRDDMAAWAGQTTGPFRLREMPGDHFYLRAERGRLLADITSVLAERTPK